MAALIRNLILAIILIVGVAFGVLNLNSATVDLLWGQVNAPLAVMLAVAFAIGLVLGLGACTLRILRLKEDLADSRRDLSKARSSSVPPTSTAPKLR